MLYMHLTYCELNNYLSLPPSLSPSLPSLPPSSTDNAGVIVNVKGEMKGI